jgi:hypothetical protein
MRLTWRDGVSALLVGACGLIFLAVSDGWGWPMLGGYRAGAAALLVVGLAACIVGGSNMTTFDTRDAMVIGATTMGSFAFAVGIWGLVTGSETAFAILLVTIVMLWIVATIHHSLVGEQHHHPVAHA